MLAILIALLIMNPIFPKNVDQPVSTYVFSMSSTDSNAPKLIYSKPQTLQGVRLNEGDLVGLGKILTWSNTNCTLVTDNINIILKPLTIIDLQCIRYKEADLFISLNIQQGEVCIEALDETHIPTILIDTQIHTILFSGTFIDVNEKSYIRSWDGTANFYKKGSLRGVSDLNNLIPLNKLDSDDIIRLQPKINKSLSLIEGVPSDSKGEQPNKMPEFPRYSWIIAVIPSDDKKTGGE